MAVLRQPAEEPMPEELTIVHADLRPGMTQLDFTGPHQFFSRLPGSEGDRRIGRRRARGGPKASTFSGLDRSCRTVAACDVLCVPGGGGATQVIDDARFMAEIRTPCSRRTLRHLRLHGFADSRRYRSCFAAKACGLSLGYIATCWPCSVRFPTRRRVVRDGNVYHRRRRHGRHRLRTGRDCRARRAGCSRGHPARP